MASALPIHPVAAHDFDAWQVPWSGYHACYCRHGDSALAPQITAPS